MLDLHAANDRAVRHAVKTGRMSNMHLIHARQRFEGFQPCFGRAESPCAQTACLWHPECMALTAFACESTPKPRAGRSAVRFPTGRNGVLGPVDRVGSPLSGTVGPAPSPTPSVARKPRRVQSLEPATVAETAPATPGVPN